MIVNGYVTLDRLKEAVGSKNNVHDNDFERAIGAASRKIDEWTGRYFYQDAAPSARLYRASDSFYVCVGDFDSTAGVSVKTDNDSDGVFETTWTSEQWQAEPFVRYNLKPYTRISATTRVQGFPFWSLRPLVQVTATWGWGAVPPQVEQACEYAATLFYRAKDQYGASIGLIDQTEKMTADPLKVAMELVREYAVEGGTLYKACSC